MVGIFIFACAVFTGIAAIGWLVAAARKPEAPAPAAVAVVTFVCGAMIGSLGAAHTIAVINQALRRPAFQYDFRLYSLILLGIFLIAGGVRCLTASWKVSRGDARAWKDALRTTTTLLAVNLPLTPIQGFAAGLSGFLVVTLLVLIATRHSFAARRDAPAAKATEIAGVVVNLAP